MWLKDLNKKRVAFFTVLGIVLGFLIFAGARASLQEDHGTHYHANFALYINGQQDKFDNFTFYEEVQSCSAEAQNNPRHRVHMHQPENHVVHVHADGVTWGHFFANLGYGLTNKAVTTDDGVFADGDGKKLTFFLNRQPVTSIANKVIESGDSLLIDYGDGTGIDERYNQIPSDAHEYNTKPDPAACSGAETLTFSERLKRAFDFTN
ncbi:hypothetical protein KY385_04790 [Candidatus Parcubacteria bacterium]|nr:hypothetical protein [Candidatus Parcubacteria bacterium]